MARKLIISLRIIHSGIIHSGIQGVLKKKSLKGKGLEIVVKLHNIID